MLSTEQLLFFRNFVGFQACASALPQQEFFRLAAHRTWKTGGKVYNEHKAVFDVLPDADVDADLVDQLGGVHISSSEDSSSHEPECETVQEAFTRFLDEQWANNGSKRPVVGSKRYNNAYARFLADEVQALYGTNDIKLHILQDLCRDAKAKDVPSTITACKKVLAKRYINIYDFLNCKRCGTDVKPVFRNYVQFCNYTLKNDLIFNKQYAKQSPFLHFLLKSFDNFDGAMAGRVSI